MCVLLDANPTHGSAPIQQEAQAASSLTVHLHQRAWPRAEKGISDWRCFYCFGGGG
jgi:hypothetical protein